MANKYEMSTVQQSGRRRNGSAVQSKEFMESPTQTSKANLTKDLPELSHT